MKIAKAVEGEIFSVDRITMLAIAFEHFVKDKFTQELCFFGAAEINSFYLPVDVAFLVRQKKIVFAIPTDEGFLFQPLQAFLNFLAQSDPVGVDFINAKSDQIVDVALDFLHV